MHVVGEAEDGREAIAGVIATHPDVAVLDVSMPGFNGAQATEELARCQPDVKILALSAHDERVYVDQMLASGASGYVVKRAQTDELVRAIRTVAAGEMFVDPSVAAPPAAPARPAPKGSRELSDRERSVLERIARGYSMHQIAAILQVSQRTVETYRTRGMAKLGAGSRADLVRHAIEQGWLE